MFWFKDIIVEETIDQLTCSAKGMIYIKHLVLYVQLSQTHYRTKPHN